MKSRTQARRLTTAAISARLVALLLLLQASNTSFAATTIVGIDLGMSTQSLDISSRLLRSVLAQAKAGDNFGLVTADELVRNVIDPQPAESLLATLKELPLDSSNSGNFTALLERSLALADSSTDTTTRLWIISNGSINLSGDSDNTAKQQRYQMWASDILLPDIASRYPDFQIITPHSHSELVVDALHNHFGNASQHLLPATEDGVEELVDTLLSDEAIVVAGPPDSPSNEIVAAKDTEADSIEQPGSINVIESTGTDLADTSTTTTSEEATTPDTTDATRQTGSLPTNETTIATTTSDKETGANRAGTNRAGTNRAGAEDSRSDSVDNNGSAVTVSDDTAGTTTDITIAENSTSADDDAQETETEIAEQQLTDTSGAETGDTKTTLADSEQPAHTTNNLTPANSALTTEDTPAESAVATHANDSEIVTANSLDANRADNLLITNESTDSATDMTVETKAASEAEATTVELVKEESGNNKTASKWMIAIAGAIGFVVLLLVAFFRRRHSPEASKKSVPVKATQTPLSVATTTHSPSIPADNLLSATTDISSPNVLHTPSIDEHSETAVATDPIVSTEDATTVSRPDTTDETVINPADQNNDTPASTKGVEDDFSAFDRSIIEKRWEKLERDESNKPSNKN